MSDDMSKIDWSKPIEAVHEDGRVVQASVFSGPDNDGDSNVNFDGMHGLYVNGDGCVYPTGWRIRNVPWNSKEPIPDDLKERCVALVRQMSVFTDVHQQHHYDEARAILAELEQVDVDLVEARKLAQEFVGTRSDWQGILEGKHDNSPAITHLQAAIKRGRQLERGE